MFFRELLKLISVIILVGGSGYEKGIVFIGSTLFNLFSRL